MWTEARYTLAAIPWIRGSQNLDAIIVSAPMRIAVKGLRRSWTIEVISGIESVGSLTIVLAFIRSFPFGVVLLRLSEALPKESNQFVVGKEFGLLPGIYFLNNALQLTGLGEFPKLNYECSSHSEFRIRPSRPCARGFLVEIMSSLRR
jgi:hypothetical protein